MKKGLLLGGLLALSAAVYAQKLALYEEFSGENCGPCAASNPGLNALLAAPGNDTKVILLKYQSPIPSAGPIYGENTTDVQNRMQYYSVPFAPYARLNGTVVGTGQNAGHIALTTQAMLDAAAAEATNFSINVGTPSITGDNFSVDVTITATAAATLSGVKLRFALLEDLEFATPPGTNGETEFHHVMRKMYPSADGQDAPASWTAGQSQVITITGTIPSYVADEAIDKFFLAWLQDDNSKAVLQAAKSASLPGPAVAIASGGISVNGDNVVCADANNFNTTATIKNMGTQTLTSATIFYKAGNGAYQAHNWSGSLASGASTNVALPAINVTTPGTITITDSVALPNGQPDVSAINNVTSTVAYMLPATAVPLPASTDYEGNSDTWIGLPGTSGAPFFTVQVNTLLQSGAGSGYDGSANAIIFPFYSVPQGTGLHVLPIAEMPAGPKALDFYVAYTQYQNENDQLEVVYSSDCGATWTPVWNKGGANLKTGNAQTAFFVPNNNSQWRMESVDVSNVPEGARIAFRAISDYGNNVFIDNVELRSGPTGVEEVIAEGSFNIYPNPVDDKLNVNLDIVKGSKVSMSIINILGQQVGETVEHSFNAGQNSTTINTATFTPGVYFLNISTEEGTVQQKFVKK